jgi:hypothetical protein
VSKPTRVKSRYNIDDLTIDDEAESFEEMTIGRKAVSKAGVARRLRSK